MCWTALGNVSIIEVSILQKNVNLQRCSSSCNHIWEIESNQGIEIYDAMLNQTNVGDNNNKFYVIQLLRKFTSILIFSSMAPST